MPPIYAAAGGAASGGGTITVYASTALDPQGDYRCDGVADEFQINAAINALPTAGGTIILSEGEFNIAGTITVNRRAVKLVGQGYDFTASGDYGTTITRGAGTFYAVDITSVGQFCTLQDLGIFNPSATANTANLVRVAASTTVLRSAYLDNARTGGNSLELVASCKLYDSEILASNNCIVLGNSGAVEAYNCTMYNLTTGYTIDKNNTTGGTRVWLFNCQLDGEQGVVRVDSSSGDPFVVIHGCLIYCYAAAPCIYVDGAGYLSIQNNIMGQFGGANAITVLNSATDRTMISGNIIEAAGRHGVSLSTVNDAQVVGNTISSTSTDTDDTYSGIILVTACDRNAVLDNRIRRAAAGNHPKYGIRVDNVNCDNNYITVNDLFLSVKTAGTGAAFSDAGTTTNTTAGNRST